MDNSFLAFLGVSVLVIVTPGPDTALTIRNTVISGRSGGVFTALGVATGQLIWAIFTSAGVVAILLASEPVFYAVKLAGAVCLVGLGAYSMLVALRRSRRNGFSVEAGAHSRLRSLAAFRQGVINNLGNPKMAVFFASILPQFAAQGHGMLSALLGLGLIFSVLTFAWLSFYATVLSAAGGILRTPGVRRVLEGVAGAVLVGLGVRLATEGR